MNLLKKTTNLSLLISLVILLTVACTETTTASQISQEDITDASKLHARAQAATAEDQQLATDMYNQGKKAAQQKKWGKAAKLYGESILLSPTMDALIGYADSSVFIKRQADNKTQQQQAKQRDLTYAAQVLDAAVQFAEKTKQGTTEPSIQMAKQKSACIKEYLKTNAIDEQCTFIEEALK